MLNHRIQHAVAFRAQRVRVVVARHVNEGQRLGSHSIWAELRDRCADSKHDYESRTSAGSTAAARRPGR